MERKSSSKDFSVAIIGGGMVGLACAIGLIREGIDVHIFEAATKFDEVGAGVGLATNALLALKGLGLLETVMNAINVSDSTRQAGFRLITGSHPHELIYDDPGRESDEGNVPDVERTGLGIYRPTFLAALLPLVPPEIVSFVKRLTSTIVLPSGQYRLSFADGTTHDVDLVIGADGIKSTVRNIVVDTPDKRRVAFTNNYIYRGIVPMAKLKDVGVETDIDKRMLVWVGFGKLIATYPIRNGTALNVAATVCTREPSAPQSPEKSYPWVQTVDRQELLDAHKDGWGSDVFKILNEMKDPSRWSLHALWPPLESYVKDRVVLIGDAAHAMVPYLGAGVGQGFEDAYALCQTLAHPKVSKKTLGAALVVYDNLRRPRANRILEESLKTGKITSGFGPDGYNLLEMRQLLKDVYESQWYNELVYYDLMGKVSTALESL